MNESLYQRLKMLDGITVQRDVPMASMTTYKIGGPADFLVTADTAAGLARLLSALRSVNTPWLVMGNGSNVLFADAGFAGTVVKLGAGFTEISLRRDSEGRGQHVLQVGGAVSITKLLRFAKVNTLAGVEALGGVPALVGGAVRMNAGTRLGEVSDTLLSAQITRADEASRWIPNRDLGLSYRHSALPPWSVVTGARFKCTDASVEMRERLAHVLAYRKSTQPLQLPSCGSVFANPPGDSAGRLIEACGLKGASEGGAQVSEKHANWIVNTAAATASDVRRLMARVVATVEQAHNVTLRHEVKFLGDWSDVIVTDDEAAKHV